MEAINNKTEMNEMRISNVESNMKITTFQTTDDGEEIESLQGKHATIITWTFPVLFKFRIKCYVVKTCSFTYKNTFETNSSN